MPVEPGPSPVDSSPHLLLERRLTVFSPARPLVRAGPPSPSLSSTKPLGKGEVGGASAEGASEESQRPEYFSGKDGEQGKDYNEGQPKTGESAGQHPAEKAADAAEILNRKADEDKACALASRCRVKPPFEDHWLTQLSSPRFPAVRAPTLEPIILTL